LVELFAGNFQRRICRVAAGALDVHFGFRNSLAAGQGLEAIELPLRERGGSLSFIDALLGFPGVEAGEDLSCVMFAP
jgi:hypothetical protein